ncbi:MAG: type II toxin-antitoxin system RelE/ParE family toxin [Pseudolabrys sp.]
MHTVIRTQIFLADAKAARLSEDQQQVMVAFIAADPLAGEILEGTGGVRKVRFARKGRGKSGAYRTVHYFAGDDVPVLLLALIDKGERANLSKAERNALRKELAGYADDYRAGARNRVVKLKR